MSAAEEREWIERWRGRGNRHELLKALRFLRRHQAGGCKRHNIAEMTAAEILTAMEGESGVRVSRPTLQSLCDKLGIPRRRRRGPDPLPADQKVSAMDRFNRMVEAKKRDGTYDAWIAARRLKGAEYREQKKLAEAAA